MDLYFTMLWDLSYPQRKVRLTVLWVLSKDIPGCYKSLRPFTNLPLQPLPMPYMKRVRWERVVCVGHADSPMKSHLNLLHCCIVIAVVPRLIFITSRINTKSWQIVVLMEINPAKQLIDSWVKMTWHMQIICKAHAQLHVQRSHSTASKPLLTSIKVLPESAWALYI